MTINNLKKKSQSYNFEIQFFRVRHFKILLSISVKRFTNSSKNSRCIQQLRQHQHWRSNQRVIMYVKTNLWNCLVLLKKDFHNLLLFGKTRVTEKNLIAPEAITQNTLSDKLKCTTLATTFAWQETLSEAQIKRQPYM